MGKPIKAVGILRDFAEEPEYFTVGLESGSRVLKAGVKRPFSTGCHRQLPAQFRHDPDRSG